MYPAIEHRLLLARRHFLGRTGFGIGSAALAFLLHEDARAGRTENPHVGLPG